MPKDQVTEKRKIGKVTILYDKLGGVIATSFLPSETKFNATTLVEKLRLSTDGVNSNEDQLKSLSDATFAAWFNSMNEIELADRDQYEVVGEKIECKRFPNGKIEKCIIEYSLQKL